jgi:hypothetical protein
MAFTEERYQLICCSTGKPLQVNGLTGVFVYSGVNLPDCHPDDFLDVVITSIKTVSGNYITGCYKILEEACKEDTWNEFKWDDTFLEVICVESCSVCLPTPVIVNPLLEQKTIYPEFIVNNVDPSKAESIFCRYANLTYKKLLALRYGIQFCCPGDIIDAQLDLEILKMDIVTDSKACCPTVTTTPCFNYEITVGPIEPSYFSTIEAFFNYKNCDNVNTVIQIVNPSATTFVICGIAGQNIDDIYIYQNITVRHNDIALTFSESNTSCV